MPRGFGRLAFITRRGSAADRSPGDAPAVDEARIDDDAPVGPPVLLPAMIYRQSLVDATEVTPVWARPRPPAEAEPAALADKAPATKPTRRRKANGSSGEPKASAAPRNPRKPSGSRRRSP